MYLLGYSLDNLSLMGMTHPPAASAACGTAGHHDLPAIHQNIQIGARLARTQYQYTFQNIDENELNTWAPKVLAKLKSLPRLADLANASPGFVARRSLQLIRADKVDEPACATPRPAYSCE